MKAYLKKIRWWQWLLIGLAAVILALGIWTAVRWIIILRARTPEVEYDPGVWLNITPSSQPRQQ